MAGGVHDGVVELIRQDNGGTSDKKCGEHHT